MRLLTRFLLLGVLWAAIAHAEVILENPLWRVHVTPETLAIQVDVKGQPSTEVSTGVKPNEVTGLSRTGRTAAWSWDAGQTKVNLALNDRDLRVSVSSTAPCTLPLLRQPAEANGKGLILPIAEGRYAPNGNAVWTNFLVKQQTMNTTEDLSLPLWGMDHGAYTLHWLLTEPFHNTIGFERDGGGVALTLTHVFDRLNPQTPMTLLLHLDGADLLAGAKRYRAWLMETGRFEPLARKLERVPDNSKLLGATHVYVWGSGLIAPRDVRDWGAFLTVLNGQSGFAQSLRRRLTADSKSALARLAQNRAPNLYEQTVITDGVNESLNAWARESWQTANPDWRRLATRYAELVESFAREFQSAMKPDRDQWGSGLSIDTIRQIEQAGLPRVWIGIGDGWEGGLWHPAAVQAAVAAGFLIAPYDSYDTALPLSGDAAWATAHLGDRAFHDCAITLADGSPKAGFLQKGHYTNPDCIRPVLEERVRILQGATGFNSWFLDSYASGMLFDDYGKAFPMAEGKMAESQSASMAWVGEHLKLPLGSEDGNATTARGIVFAHGMQTPVMGWGDAEMQKMPQSPYFLGRWYPPSQPQAFFKTVPLKDALRTLHFDPRFRLPLYQAVFHDSIITTHHWSYDNWKFSNTRLENELVQLLYNVPPLFHLSTGTLKDRLPAMRRQSDFFAPLHHKLATQALSGFAWLSEDRRVQETRFANGTKLTANFDAVARVMDGRTLPAHSITATDGKATKTYIARADR